MSRTDSHQHKSEDLRTLTGQTVAVAPDPWWRSAVVYQIYPRSFAASTDSGVGDLEGIRRRLDYLAWLGVDAVWLSPFYRSPMADFGYDVSDYCDVDPRFGTLDDFDRLLATAHDLGIRVIVDWVPNHTSDEHPWFVESRRTRSSSRRDWYIWRDGTPDRPPNNWKAAFGGGAWTYDAATEQWYLHLYLPQQPDLNWSNPDVVAAMQATMRFWLDRGVDGFRIDVVHCLGKDPMLLDHAPELVDVPHSRVNDYAGTHDILQQLRQVTDAYPGDRMMVGEVILRPTALIAPYYGTGNQLHLTFDFSPLFAPWDAAVWRARIDEVVRELDPREAWATWVLSNHDKPRQRTRYGGSEQRARAAAVLLLTLRGTPFLYAGEELGLEDAVVPRERRVDPGGRDGCRAPIPWDGSPIHGWSVENAWLPWPPEAGTRNVAAQRADERSILHLYRRLLAVRRSSAALRLGTWTPLPAPDGVLAYERASGHDRRAVIVNFSNGRAAVPLDGDWTVEVASDGSGEGGPYGGTAPPSGALVLR